MSDRMSIKIDVDITYDDVIRKFSEIDQKIRSKVIELFDYPEVKITLVSFCLQHTIDDKYVVLIKYRADVRYKDLSDTKTIDVVIRGDRVYAIY